MTAKKYREKFYTTLTCERRNIDILHGLGKSVPLAFEIGLKVLIDVALLKKEDLDHEVLKLICQFKEQESDEIFGLMEQQRMKELAARALAEAKPKTKKKVRVWDNSLERTVIISEDQFDPRWHTLKGTIEEQSEERGAITNRQEGSAPGHPLVEE